MVWNGRFISLTTLALTQSQKKLFYFNIIFFGGGGWVELGTAQLSLYMQPFITQSLDDGAVGPMIKTLADT